MMDVKPLKAPARVMTFRSLMSPVGSLAAVAAPPSNRKGRYFSRGCSAPSMVSRMSSPSMTVRTRSIPANAEKSPALATSAMLTRQSNPPSSEPWRAISLVTPPPLRHGSALSSAKRMICISPA